MGWRPRRAATPNCSARWRNAYRRAGDVQGDPLSSNLGDTAGARRSYEHSIRLLEGLPGRDARKDLARGYNQLASMERVSGNVGRARELASKALPLAEMTAAPRDEDSQQLLGDVHITLAWVLDTAGQVADAADHAGKALSIYRTLPGLRPAVLGHLATAYKRARVFQMRLGQLTRPRILIGKTSRSGCGRPRRNRKTPLLLRNLMLAQAHVGDTTGKSTVSSLSDWAGALASYREALSIAKQDCRHGSIGQEKPNWILRRRHDARRQLPGRSGTTRMALAQLEEALAITDELAAADPNNGRLAQNDAFIEARLGTQLETLGRRSEALKFYRKSLEFRAAGLRRIPRTPLRNPERVWAMEMLRYASRSRESTMRHANTSRKSWLWASALPGRGDPKFLQAQKPRAYAAAGAIEEAVGRRNEARAWYRKSVDGWASMVAHQPFKPQSGGRGRRYNRQTARLTPRAAFAGTAGDGKLKHTLPCFISASVTVFDRFLRMWKQDDSPRVFPARTRASHGCQDPGLCRRCLGS